MIRKFVVALAGTLVVSQAAFAADEYPRLGVYAIGSPKDYNTAEYQKQLAKVQVAVVNIYPGWEKSRKLSLDALAKNIKAINPNTRVFNYVIAEGLTSPANEAYADEEAKVNSEKWWLYTSKLDTSKVLTDFGHDVYVLNITTQSKKNSAGQTFGQWFAGYVASLYITPNTALDGLFSDNVFWKPRRDGDWNLDGKTDSQNDATVQSWYRAGYRQYADTLKKAMPGKLQLANVADWGQSNAVLTEYKGVWNGGVLEHIIGKSYSPESSSWSNLMAHYRKTMDALAAPKLGLFQQDGSASDYRGMRYGLASCLMDDGYYTFANQDHPTYGVTWFDEFDAKLGAAVSKPQTAAWQAGVYRRDFEKGIVLVNPKGNGTREVTLEGDFVKIKGTQDPKTNDGSTVRKVTLQDRDGIILLRSKPVKRPAPPGGISTTASN